MPDFELRIVPASINIRAGTIMPLTVYALRKDGFSDDITLKLKDPPKGFTLSGAWIPAGQDKIRLTLAAPADAPAKPADLHVEGYAKINGQEVCKQAVPSEDMMQAFFYRHLVPVQEQTVFGVKRDWVKPPPSLVSEKSVKIPTGGTARVEFVTSSKATTNQFSLELSEPPDGISIKEVSVKENVVAVELQAEAGKVKPGLKGNLIINAFSMKKPEFKKGKTKPTKTDNSKFFMGSLPAVPFEIVSQ